MDKSAKDYIKDNYQSLSIEQIAQKLNVKKRKVEKYIKSLTAQSEETTGQSGIFPKKHLLASIIGIFITGFVIYANSLNASFQFDDFHFIVNNPTIKVINNLFMFDRLTMSLSVRWIGFLSFALNYHFHQLDVFGYHLVNLFIHIFNGFLVYWLAYLTLNTPKMLSSKIAQYKELLPLIAALIFIAHPLQTEGVTYICQRFASLATLFYLASVCFYAAARLSKGGRSALFFFGAIIAAILGMFTKQITITLPAIILLYEFSFLERKKSKGIVATILIAVFVLAGALIPSIYSYNFDILSGEGYSHSHDGDFLNNKIYLMTQFRVIATYMRLLVFPVGQRLDYDFTASTSMLDPKTLFCFLLIVSFLILAIKLFTKHRMIAFGIFWFFICLSVESSIIVIANVIFEHRVYLPLVGFSFVLAALLCQIINSRISLLALSTIIIALLSGLTIVRNNVWQTEKSMWQDVVKKSYKKYRAYYSLGMAYGKEGNQKEMIKYFERGLKVAPQNPKAYNNLGIAHASTNTQIAREYFEKTVEVDPNFVEGYTNLGAMYAKAGDSQKAAAVFKKAIELNPGYAAGYNNLGAILMREGKLNDAKKYFEKALSLNRDYKDARDNLREISKRLR